MASVCKRIADSQRFQNFIYVVIVLNAITLGLGTYDWSETVNEAITVADDTFLGIFVIELVIRIAAFGRRPQDFFKDGWNVFDFIVIGARLPPGAARQRHAAAARAAAACCAPGQRHARPADSRPRDGARRSRRSRAWSSSRCC